MLHGDRPDPGRPRRLGLHLRDHRRRRRVHRRLERRSWPGSRASGSSASRTNRGSGSARRAGTAAAKGRVTVWTDADMTYPNERIPELVKQLDAGLDQVVGARTSEQGTCEALRVPAKWPIRRLAQLPRRDADPRPQLGSAGLPHRRGPPVPPPAAGRLLVRHHHHDGVPRQRLLGGLRRHRLRASGRGARSSTGGGTRSATSSQVIRMVLSYNPLRVFLPVATLLGIDRRA